MDSTSTVRENRQKIFNSELNCRMVTWFLATSVNVGNNVPFKSNTTKGTDPYELKLRSVYNLLWFMHESLNIADPLSLK
jgi:hypothetical protein